MFLLRGNPSEVFVQPFEQHLVAEHCKILRDETVWVLFRQRDFRGPGGSSIRHPQIEIALGVDAAEQHPPVGRRSKIRRGRRESEQPLRTDAGDRNLRGSRGGAVRDPEIVVPVFIEAGKQEDIRRPPPLPSISPSPHAQLCNAHKYARPRRNIWARSAREAPSAANMVAVQRPIRTVLRSCHRRLRRRRKPRATRMGRLRNCLPEPSIPC